MTGEKITSRWLEHRHANCFQLIAAFCLIFINWITVRLFIWSQEAADQFLGKSGCWKTEGILEPVVRRESQTVLYTFTCPGLSLSSMDKLGEPVRVLYF